MCIKLCSSQSVDSRSQVKACPEHNEGPETSFAGMPKGVHFPFLSCREVGNGAKQVLVFGAENSNNPQKNLIMVTEKVREFKRILNLKIENWVQRS